MRTLASRRVIASSPSSCCAKTGRSYAHKQAPNAAIAGSLEEPVAASP